MCGAGIKDNYFPGVCLQPDVWMDGSFPGHRNRPQEKKMLIFATPAQQRTPVMAAQVNSAGKLDCLLMKTLH